METTRALRRARPKPPSDDVGDVIFGNLSTASMTLKTSSCSFLRAVPAFSLRRVLRRVKLPVPVLFAGIVPPPSRVPSSEDGGRGSGRGLPNGSGVLAYPRVRARRARRDRRAAAVAKVPRLPSSLVILSRSFFSFFSFFRRPSRSFLRPPRLSAPPGSSRAATASRATARRRTATTTTATATPAPMFADPRAATPGPNPRATACPPSSPRRRVSPPHPPQPPSTAARFSITTGSCSPPLGLRGGDLGESAVPFALSEHPPERRVDDSLVPAPVVALVGVRVVVEGFSIRILVVRVERSAVRVFPVVAILLLRVLSGVLSSSYSSSSSSSSSSPELRTDSPEPDPSSPSSLAAGPDA